MSKQEACTQTLPDAKDEKISAVKNENILKPNFDVKQRVHKCSIYNTENVLTL